MGCGSSSTAVSPNPDAKLSAAMDSTLKNAAEEEAKRFKLLCLGAGESGKSTLVKQLAFLYNPNFVEDPNTYIIVLHGNIMQCILVLIRQTERFGYDADFTDEEKDMKERVVGMRDQIIPQSVANDIDRLWRSVAVMKTYERRSEFWLLETANYYLDHCLQYTTPGFTPSEDDIVRARKRTTGVTSMEFDFNSRHWELVDVGGQRSERKKWLNCFDGVQALIYVVNLSGYNSVLFEEQSRLRMLECLELFQLTISNSIFSNLPVFILFNKLDLFQLEILKYPITKCFPDFKGNTSSSEDSMQYIIQQFKNAAAKKENGATAASLDKLYVHVLSACDKKQVKAVWEKMQSQLLHK